MSLEFETRIESYDVHPNNNARLSALFKLFQKVAGDDLDSVGLTYNYLRQKNIVFVLTKMNIKFFVISCPIPSLIMKSNPELDRSIADSDNVKTYDNVKIITRPRGCKGASYIRDYDVYVDKKRVAYCTSHWAIINFESRKLLRPATIAADFNLKDDNTDIVEIDDKKIRVNIDLLQKTDVRRVYYSLIDKNEHMNNTFYPDIVYDYAPEDIKKTFKDKQIVIQYTTEIKCGEDMEIYSGMTDDGFAVVARKATTDKIIFTALIQ